ncbi:MAG: glycosyltransferase family 4 protein [Bacilli bacterium]|jgi:glycosyltransferase involved in cell wall biosynthesis
MNIIYLTTSMMPNDFTKLCKMVKNKPNPSGQIFHYKIISELQKTNDVRVISLRPVSPNATIQYFNLEINDHYIYPSFVNRKALRHLTFTRSAKKIIAKFKFDEQPIIMVDLLNVTLTKLAFKLNQKYGWRIVGILTDNPNNLTNVSKRYIENVEKRFKICSGFITLTEELEKYVNHYNRDSLIFSGILGEEKVYPKPDLDFEYVFFAGALYERYGIQTLLDAFKLIDFDAKLIIAGHGKLTEYIATLADNDPRIIFLGLIPFEEAQQYQQHSLMNLNPRLFTSTLDFYSVPSKVLEYANSGRPTVSSIHHDLYKMFGDSIFWVNNINAKTLSEKMNYVYANYDHALKKAKEAKEIANNNFGSEIIGEAINNFLRKI